MTSVLLRPDDGPPPDVGHTDPEAAGRGRLELRPKAVESLATAAAAEVEAAGGPVTRVLGQALGRADPDARPRAHATVAGDVVTLELSLSVPWPSPVAEVADEVRRRIADRLQALAGLRLGHADITVTSLPSPRRRRRVQ
jgi:uncharacterized alkaline shock family protein YloU